MGNQQNKITYKVRQKPRANMFRSLPICLLMSLHMLTYTSVEGTVDLSCQSCVEENCSACEGLCQSNGNPLLCTNCLKDTDCDAVGLSCQNYVRKYCETCRDDCIEGSGKLEKCKDCMKKESCPSSPQALCSVPKCSN